MGQGCRNPWQMGQLSKIDQMRFLYDWPHKVTCILMQLSRAGLLKETAKEKKFLANYWFVE